MVIAIMSILEILFLTIIVGLYFCIIHHVLKIVHKGNKDEIHRIVKHNIYLTILLMIVVWISASVLTLKNVGIFIYTHQLLGYTTCLLVALIFVYALQRIWSKVAEILKENITHINHSDTVQTLNRWRNKK